MSTISVLFQFDDEKATEINFPPEFTLDDFKREANKLCPYNVLLHTLDCHEKELNLKDETIFNQQKSLIISGTTIFISTLDKCFLPDTLIQRADLSEIPIRDVKIGDILLAFIDSGKVVTTVVENILIHEVDQYFEIHVGQKLLRATREHPLFIGNGIFVGLDKLRINDCVYLLIDDYLQSTPITAIEPISAPGTCVYNLSTTYPHTYFANGVAVHNKKGKMFIDLTKKTDPKRIPWSNTAPSWRRTRPGICLEGRCMKNTLCNAHKQLVVVNIGIRESFDFLREHHKLSKCPECSEYVNPITAAFNNCLWSWEGLIENENGDEPKDVQGEWKEADNAYHRFDHYDDDNDGITWLHLILKAKPRNKTN